MFQAVYFPLPIPSVLPECKGPVKDQSVASSDRFDDDLLYIFAFGCLSTWQNAIMGQGLIPLLTPSLKWLNSMENLSLLKVTNTLLGRSPNRLEQRIKEPKWLPSRGKNASTKSNSTKSGNKNKNVCIMAGTALIHLINAKLFKLKFKNKQRGNRMIP
mgnify:CR=1 FL=1